jgi:heme/copper-type cytochrome/quinol oxidase subunit 3
LSYNFRFTPIVRGRYPVWNQPDLPTAMEEGEPRDDVLPGLSATRREGFVTTLMDAVPDHITVFAGPSLWPIALALDAALFFVGTLAGQYALAALAAPLAVAVLVAWHWPSRTPVDDDVVRPLPVDVSDARATGWWGMALILVAQGVLFGSFVIAYFYLAGNNRAWPPPGIARPQAVVPIIGAALGLAAAAATWAAVAGVERGRRSRLLLGLGLGLILGLASLAALVFEMIRQPFGLGTHAYASAFLVILGVQAVQMAAAALFLLAALFWAWRGYYDERRHLAVRHAWLYWLYIAAAWLVLLATLYLAPYALEIG